MFTKRRSSKNLTVQIGYDGLNKRHSSKKGLHDNGSAGNHSLAGDAVSVASGRTASTPSPQMISASSSGATPPMAESPAAEAPSTVAPPTSTTTTTSTKTPKASSRGSSSHGAGTAEPPAKSLVIGEGVVFEGATEGCAAAIVGGKLRGTVKSRRLEITRLGKMEGTAIAETAEIAGVFEGNLAVSKALKICSTGRLKGEVSFGSIVVENGGKLEGKVNFSSSRGPNPNPTPAAAAPASGSDHNTTDFASTSFSKLNPVSAVGLRATEDAPSTPRGREGRPTSAVANSRASYGAAWAAGAPSGDDPAPPSPECPAEVNALVTPRLSQTPE